MKVILLKSKAAPAAVAGPKKWDSPLSQQPGKEHVTNLHPNLCNGLPVWSVSTPADQSRDDNQRLTRRRHRGRRIPSDGGKTLRSTRSRGLVKL